MVFLFSQSEGTRLQKDLRTYLASVKGKISACRKLFLLKTYLCSEAFAAIPFLVFPVPRQEF